MDPNNIPLLDAALDVFLRYGFKRTTMGDIAKAANMSRPSLYARYANKDEVYAAVLALHIDRTLSALQNAWTNSETLSEKMDCLWDVSVLPAFEILRQSPDAADIIEGAETPAGQVAMAAATQRVVEVISEILVPFESAISKHKQTPEQLARFIDLSKQMMLRTANDTSDLKQQFSTLKAAVLALTHSR